MVALKEDADQIEAFLSDLAEGWVKRTERSTWPKFVYHYTDIRNAVSILRDGCLLSRRQLTESGRDIVDSASPAVLAGTPEPVRDCVRFYFRPKTPTQYHMEGICSATTLAKSKFPAAHCPVPVFLLFDSAAILTRADCQFSDGGLGRARARLLSTAAELSQLPWHQIYHNRSFVSGSPAGDEIVFRRNAEVLIPQWVDLKALRAIYCRSEAEKETLLHLLNPALRKRYGRTIVSTLRSDHFFRDQTYIERVRLSRDDARFYFSPETQSKGPFHLRVDHESGSARRHFENDDFSLNLFQLRVALSIKANQYTIRLKLDGHLAYSNSYEELPF